MKKHIIIFMMALVAIPSGFALGEESLPQASPTRQNIIKERLEKQRNNYRQNLEEARKIAEEYRNTTNPEERKNLRVETRQGFMVRLTNTAERLSALQDRVEARILKAKEDGFDTKLAEEELATSRKHLEIVLNEQENLKEIFSKETLSDEIGKEDARESFEIIKENLNLARKSLILSIQTLRMELQGNDESQTTVEENEITGVVE